MVDRIMSSKTGSPSKMESAEEEFLDVKTDVTLRVAPFLDRDRGDADDNDNVESPGARTLRQRRFEQLKAETLTPPPPPVDDSYDIDWDAEEELLNKQAEAAKREMAKLQKRRDRLRFNKRQGELKDEYTERLRVAKQQTERELQSRVAAIRTEAKDRINKVEAFKGEIKERIDALCRCYEEVSVRAVQMEAAFKEAEEKLVGEAKRAVAAEKDKCETELRRRVTELASELKVG